MKHWEIAFTGNWPAVLVMLGAAGAAVLAYVFYRHKRSRLSRTAFASLAGLRALVIAIVALFLLQPVLRLTRTERAQATVAVLVDSSESMGIRDSADDRSRFEASVDLLTRPPHAVLDALARSQKVRLFAFGPVIAELPGSERLAELSPQEKATAIGKALKDVVRETRQEEVSGVVLLTDGVCTHGVEPEEVAPGLGVPVFAVALGGRIGQHGLFHDLGVSRVPQNPRFIVNNEATVKLEVAWTGLEKFTDAEREVELRLLEGDEQLAAETLQLAAEDGSAERELRFVPGRVGLHMLRAEVDTLADETVTENNGRSFTVEVTDPRISVLIVEGAVRSEYRFLRRVLESDPNLEVTGVVKLSGERYLVQGVQLGVDLSRGLPSAPEDYKDIDVVVLGDVGREEFTGLQLEYLTEFVDGGGALLALGGYHAFGAGGYADSALADVLPVTMQGERDGHVEEAFLPALTQDGRAHPVFDGAAGFFEGPDAPATLDGANRVAGSKPGAQVLAVHPTERAGDRPMPVVAAQSYGSGRAMALTADTTWKWKFQVEARGLDSPYYRFWRQSIRWLAGREQEEPAPEQLVSAWPARVEHEPDEPVVLKARVRNRNGEPEDGAAVEVSVTYPIAVARPGPDGQEVLETGTTVSLAPLPLSLGEYQASWRPPASGLYQAAASARDEAGELGTARFEFVVGRATSEFDRVDVAEDTLRFVANQTGGAYHTLATAGKIPEEIEQRRSLVARREEKNLWNTPWFFAAVLACATAEWILRKRRALN